MSLFKHFMKIILNMVNNTVPLLSSFEVCGVCVVQLRHIVPDQPVRESRGQFEISKQKGTLPIPSSEGD